MKEYVVILPIVSGSKATLLVTKAKPEWQKGKLNLLGGSIEYGETPEQAVIRELQEESGIEVIKVVKAGRIIGKDFIVHCFYTELGRSYIRLNPRPEEIEHVDFYDWDTIKVDPRLIDNLKVIIPLLRMRVTNWTILGDDNRFSLTFGD